MTTRSAHVSRRALQTALALLSLIPIGTGLMGMTGGVQMLPSDQVPTADLESNYRFLQTIWFGVGLLILWIIPRVETALGPFRFVCVISVTGGLVRLGTMAVAGVPDPIFVAATVSELVAPPLMVLWQARVARTSAPKKAARPEPAGRP